MVAAGAGGVSTATAGASLTGDTTSSSTGTSLAATTSATSATTSSGSGGASSSAGNLSATSMGSGGMATTGTSGAGGGTGGLAASSETTSSSVSTGMGGMAAGGNGGTGGMDNPMLPPTDDYSAKGPFDTTVDQGMGPNGGYTVFRPEPLGENGFLHAPIVFGPGIGQQVTVHTEMLTYFASHGFVVVGCPVLSGGPGDAGNRMTMLNGLEWILEQNSAPGIYQGKLYTDHAVSMGFSVGGTSAVEIGGHEAVMTVVSIHGHRASAELHGTLLQTTGTQDTVGMPLQEQTYEMSQVPTFLATLTGAPHQYIESNAGGEQRPAIVAWMRYWIYDDMGARDYFFGDDCVLCQAPWENPRRKNWD